MPEPEEPFPEGCVPCGFPFFRFARYSFGLLNQFALSGTISVLNSISCATLQQLAHRITLAVSDRPSVLTKGQGSIHLLEVGHCLEFIE